MIASISRGKKEYKINLDRPLDISIALNSGHSPSLNAWGIPGAEIGPYSVGDYIGLVSKGASVNFNNLKFNPHSHITHTECVGHITETISSVNQLFPSKFFFTKVVTIAPEKYQDDYVISRKQLQYAIGETRCEALVIRTLPNTVLKRNKDYSNTNPPYLLEEAAIFLVEREIFHLLVDLPSVDKEDDFGALLAHRAFWNMDGEIRRDATITELIYVENAIADGMYLLNIQTAPIENDATPSRPVLYKIIEE